MKITSFNPTIISNKSKDLISLFEELGFEKRHQKDDLSGDDVHCVRMADAMGHHVDIISSERVDKDWTLIRMNVDDINEAKEELISKGFTVVNELLPTSSSLDVVMKSASGFYIHIVEHLKNKTL